MGVCGLDNACVLDSSLLTVKTEEGRKIIHAFISSHLDYCNALYVNVSQSSLQRVHHVASALVTCSV